MRKFCAWDAYEEFLYLDSDVVVVDTLAPYFSMLAGSGADFVHFATDLGQVYRDGPLRERMVAEHGAAGFNSGAFMGRRGDLTAAAVERCATDADGRLPNSSTSSCATASPRSPRGGEGATAQAWLDATAEMTPRRAYHKLRRAPYRLRGWLAARGLARWKGSGG